MSALALALGALVTLSTAEGGAQAGCELPPGGSGVGTYGAGAADSPGRPGRVLARLGGVFACPEGAEWWFEYGPTAQYGERTVSNHPSVPVILREAEAVVRADVDGLVYRRTYHYRLVVHYPDGQVRTGRDVSVRMQPAPLRPPQRVTVEFSKRPTPERSVFDRITVLDAPAGAKVTVRCEGTGSGDLCKPFERKLVLGGRPTVFRNWRVRQPAHIEVVVAGRGMPTSTAIRPRLRRGPRLETECGGYPVVLGTRCIGVTLESQGRKVRSLTVSDVLRGSDVEIICRGRGCPSSDFETRIDTPAEEPYARLRPEGYTRLKPGAKVWVFVRRRFTNGLARSFRVTRRRVVSSSYRCLSPTEPRTAVDCPTTVPVRTG